MTGVGEEGNARPSGVAPEGTSSPRLGLLEGIKLAWKGLMGEGDRLDQKDLKARTVRTLAVLRAWWLGFSPEQCARIQAEVGDKLREDRLLLRQRDGDGYLVFSKTFREHPLGWDYLQSERVQLSDRDLRQLAVADRLRGELLAKLPGWPSKETVTVLYNDIRQDYSLLDRITDTQFSDVSKTHAYGYLLGLTPSEAKRLANEVFHADKKWQMAEVVTADYSVRYGSALRRIVQTPTLLSCPLGRDLVTLAKANIEADCLVMQASGKQPKTPLASSVLEVAEAWYAKEEGKVQRVAFTEERGIGDDQAERAQGQGSDQVLLTVLRGQGFLGLRDYLGNDTLRYNRFVAAHQLTEVALGEERTRQQGGDWLQATQDALKERMVLGLSAERMVSNASRQVAP